MRLLVDTHVLLWVLDEAYRIGPDLNLLLEDPNTEVMVSAVSVWEIAIKCALGRGNFRHRPEAIAAAAHSMGFIDLPITGDTACRVADLPRHRRDPFDRMLVAQALAGPYRVYTADPVLLPYSELVHLAA